jgi:hypothetical protein
LGIGIFRAAWIERSGNEEGERTETMERFKKDTAFDNWFRTSRLKAGRVGPGI